jgi:hypothetical protein
MLVATNVAGRAFYLGCLRENALERHGGVSFYVVLQLRAQVRRRPRVPRGAPFRMTGDKEFSKKQTDCRARASGT